MHLHFRFSAVSCNTAIVPAEAFLLQGSLQKHESMLEQMYIELSEYICYLIEFTSL